MLTVVNMIVSITLADGQSSESGIYEVPREVYLQCLQG